jgi:hypothetical protein
MTAVTHSSPLQALDIQGGLIEGQRAAVVRQSQTTRRPHAPLNQNSHPLTRRALNNMFWPSSAFSSSAPPSLSSSLSLRLSLRAEGSVHSVFSAPPAERPQPSRRAISGDWNQAGARKLVLLPPSEHPTFVKKEYGNSP